MLAATGRALWHAVRSGSFEMVERLVLEGADVNAEHEGTRPIHLAAALGDARILELLLAHKAKVDVCSPMDQTPLDIAAIEGAVSCAKLLIAVRADVLRKSFVSGKDAEALAMTHGQTAMVALLQVAKTAEGRAKIGKEVKVSDGNVLESAGTLAAERLGDELCEAALRGDAEACGALLRKGADANAMHTSRGERVLHCAARSGELPSLLGMLLEHRARLESRARKTTHTALMIAAVELDAEACRVLMVAGARIDSTNAHGYNAAELAVRASGRVDASDVLTTIDEIGKLDFEQLEELKVEVLPEYRERKAVMRASELLKDLTNAVRSLDVEETRWLLLQSDVEANSAKRPALLSSVLQFATSRCTVDSRNLEIIEALVENKASLDAADETGDKPIVIAVKLGLEPTVKLLLALGANPDDASRVRWNLKESIKSLLTIARSEDGLEKLRIESISKHAEEVRLAEEAAAAQKQEALLKGEMEKAERAKAQLAALEERLAARHLEVATVAAASVRERRNKIVTLSNGVECPIELWMLGDRGQWALFINAVTETLHTGDADTVKLLRAFCGDKPLHVISTRKDEPSLSLSRRVKHDAQSLGAYVVDGRAGPCFNPPFDSHTSRKAELLGTSVAFLSPRSTAKAAPAAASGGRGSPWPSSCSSTSSMTHEEREAPSRMLWQCMAKAAKLSGGTMIQLLSATQGMSMAQKVEATYAAEIQLPLTVVPVPLSLDKMLLDKGFLKVSSFTVTLDMTFPWGSVRPIEIAQSHGKLRPASSDAEVKGFIFAKLVKEYGSLVTGSASEATLTIEDGKRYHLSVDLPPGSKPIFEGQPQVDELDVTWRLDWCCIEGDSSTIYSTVVSGQQKDNVLTVAPVATWFWLPASAPEAAAATAAAKAAALAEAEAKAAAALAAIEAAKAPKRGKKKAAQPVMSAAELEAAAAAVKVEPEPIDMLAIVAGLPMEASERIATLCNLKRLKLSNHPHAEEAAITIECHYRSWKARRTTLELRKILALRPSPKKLQPKRLADTLSRAQMRSFMLARTMMENAKTKAASSKPKINWI